MTSHTFLITFAATLFLYLFNNVSSIGVTELQTLNFELAVASYNYVAILFYDSSAEGQRLKKLWKDSANEVSSICKDCAIAQIDATDPELNEIIDAYVLQIPCLRVFRRGIMGEWRGPDKDSAAVATYLEEDAQPSVQVITNLNEIKTKLRYHSQTNPNRVTVLGFFDISEDEAYNRDEHSSTSEGYSIAPWGQFQASADTLRGHAIYYGLLPNDELLDSFKVTREELPIIYLVSEGGDALIPFHGEILESSITEWILRHSSPTMSELSFSKPSGELYATQFFSSKKLKFILFFPDTLTPLQSEPSLTQWKLLSDTFHSQAIFSYMYGNAVPDVLEYFNLKEKADFPLIVAHDPTKDYKYISSKKLNLPSNNENMNTILQEFVAGVISGKIKRVMKSEPVPKKNKNNNQLVMKVVGTNVIDIVSKSDTDVLLEIYAPWCQHCKKLMPTLEILAKAVAAERRILIAKIDGTLNDLPLSWNVKTYPTILWFPAKDKPYAENKGGPTPRPYWDAGTGLVEFISFIQRHSSFDAQSLKIATSEQINSLLGDEDILRQKYEIEELKSRRNEGREYYENEIVDYILGEVVFDGQRWHIGIVAVLGCIILIQSIYILILHSQTKKTTTIKKKKTQ